MPTYSHNDIVLVRYPFSDLSSSKVRPAVVINRPHISQDLIIVPITSVMDRLLPGEFGLEAWQSAGLNVPSAIKRGIYTVDSMLVLKRVGQLHAKDIRKLQQSLSVWLFLS